ncbi:hypothetical protein EPO66_01685 [bacterium]|nr:MAG: hypothetical protein EPO66_01685 [bacterium]
MAVKVPKRIVIDLSLHLAATSFLALLVYSLTKDLRYIWICILGGILLDIDHFVDYFIYFKFKFNLDNFFDCRYLESGKTYLIFHSWELVLLNFILAVKTGSVPVYVFFLSMVIHLLIDNMQRDNLLAYFLLYRIARKFNSDILLPEYKGRMK